ncbi:MAG: acetate kinase [Synechococcales cyanobacterium RM1_1_8]|nr:acetate kinase [Synechococcales cyanobacterium RM1_1_8]
MNILVLNAGSSSQKSCLYSISGDRLPSAPPEPLWEGSIDWSHRPGQAELKITGQGRTRLETLPYAGPGSEAGASDSGDGLVRDRSTILQHLLQSLWQGEQAVLGGVEAIQAIGHRVVHGGQAYRAAVRIDAQVQDKIRELIPLAPAHNPANLEGIVIAQQLFGEHIPQFAIFDTAFHSHLPEAAAVYPGPYAWLEQGIRRYGFHGISHEYCAQRAAQLLGQDLAQLKLITCHLGNGCSLAAIRNGHSIDTTMGFTPLEGLMMGSRSGSVDPGILIYLMRQQGLGADALEQLLNKQSGLLGLSGVSQDMREIQGAITLPASSQITSDQSRSKLAFEVYIHRINRGIGAMLASLGGLDGLVFTAGVGENSGAVRSQVCQAFQFLGLQLDEALNEACNQGKPGDQNIAQADSKIPVLVIHTQEDWQIARTCWGQLTDI